MLKFLFELFEWDKFLSNIYPTNTSHEVNFHERKHTIWQSSNIVSHMEMQKLR